MLFLGHACRSDDAAHRAALPAAKRRQAMSHLWMQGDPIEVLPDEMGTPSSFTWHGQSHQITGIANRWLIDEGWWQERVKRQYFKLRTASGFLVIIYQDLLRNQWYLQRL